MKALLLPGTLCDQSLWEKVVLPAEATSLETLRGASLRAAAQQVLDALPGPFHLIGFSLGAIVAFEALRWAPERVAQLTLISANPHAPTNAQLEAWAEQERQVRAGQFDEVVWQMSLSAGPLQDSVQQMAQRCGADTFLEQLNMLRSRPDSRQTLAAYQGPCRLIVGADDRVTPPNITQEMAALLPQAQVQVVPGAGHYLPLEAPNVVAQALAGLSQEVKYA